MRLRLAALVVFTAGFLAAALGPHCARMFAAADPAPMHHAGMDHGHHGAPAPQPEPQDCAAMSAPDGVLVAAALLTPPGFDEVAPPSFAASAELPLPGIAVAVLRPPRPPPDAIALQTVRTHRLLI